MSYRYTPLSMFALLTVRLSTAAYHVLLLAKELYVFQERYVNQIQYN